MSKTILEVGIEREAIVCDIIAQQLNPISIERNKTRGIDIIADMIKIEVKSAQSIVKSNKRKRRGRFNMTKKEIGRADYFAFFIKYKRDYEVYFVDVKHLRDLAANRGERFSLTIPQLFRLPRKLNLRKLILEAEEGGK